MFSLYLSNYSSVNVKYSSRCISLFISVRLFYTSTLLRWDSTYTKLSDNIFWEYTCACWSNKLLSFRAVKIISTCCEMAAAYDLLLLQITPTFLLDEDDKPQIIRMLIVHSTTNQMTTGPIEDCSSQYSLQYRHFDLLDETRRWYAWYVPDRWRLGCQTLSTTRAPLSTSNCQVSWCPGNSAHNHPGPCVP